MSSAYDLVTPDAGDTERAAEAALRPRHLEDFVGQLVVREQLSLVLEAAMRALPPTSWIARSPYLRPREIHWIG